MGLAVALAQPLLKTTHQAQAFTGAAAEAVRLDTQPAQLEQEEVFLLLEAMGLVVAQAVEAAVSLTTRLLVPELVAQAVAVLEL
jgi:hypothetical protein